MSPDIAIGLALDWPTRRHMPVPVPLYKTYSTHQTHKARPVKHDHFASPGLNKVFDDGAKYVIHRQESARPVLSALINPEGSRFLIQQGLSDCIGDRLNSAIHLVESQHPPKTAVSQHGLTPAADAGLSQQGHAEACSSPARGSDRPSMTISSHLRGSSEAAWSGYDVVDGMHAAGYTADAKGWGAPRVNGAFARGDEYSYYPAFDGMDQAYGCGLAQHPTTPFAEYIDRMVASDSTLANEYDIGSTGQSQQVLASPVIQQRRAVPTEPLSNPFYIKAYRSMAESLSEWIATYVWKMCNADIGLGQRYGGVS